MIAFLLLVADVEAAVPQDIHADPPAVLVLRRGMTHRDPPKLRYHLDVVARWHGESKTPLPTTTRHGTSADADSHSLPIEHIIAAELERGEVRDRSEPAPQS